MNTIIKARLWGWKTAGNAMMAVSSAASSGAAWCVGRYMRLRDRIWWVGE